MICTQADHLTQDSRKQRVNIFYMAYPYNCTKPFFQIIPITEALLFIYKSMSQNNIQKLVLSFYLTLYYLIYQATLYLLKNNYSRNIRMMKESKPQIEKKNKIDNMSSILPINTLRSEFKFSDIHKKAIREKVEPRYSYWRKIRGDGNCYYRAVYVHYIEYLIFKGPQYLKCFVSNFEQKQCPIFIFKRYFVQYEKQYLKGLLKKIMEIHNLMTQQNKRQGIGLLILFIEQHIIFFINIFCNLMVKFRALILQDYSILFYTLLQGMIVLMRLMVANLIRKNVKFQIASLPIEFIIDEKYESVFNFIKKNVTVLGQQAQDLIISFMPLVLRINIRMCILDKEAAGGLLIDDKLSRANDNTSYFQNNDKLDLHDDFIHLIFKPGHYEVLYPRYFVKQNQSLFKEDEKKQYLSNLSLQKIQKPCFSVGSQSKVEKVNKDSCFYSQLDDALFSISNTSTEYDDYLFELSCGHSRQYQAVKQYLEEVFPCQNVYSKEYRQYGKRFFKWDNGNLQVPKCELCGVNLSFVVLYHFDKSLIKNRYEKYKLIQEQKQQKELLGQQQKRKQSTFAQVMKNPKFDHFNHLNKSSQSISQGLQEEGYDFRKNRQVFQNRCYLLAIIGVLAAFVINQILGRIY